MFGFSDYYRNFFVVLRSTQLAAVLFFIVFQSRIFYGVPNVSGVRGIFWGPVSRGTKKENKEKKKQNKQGQSTIETHLQKFFLYIHHQIAEGADQVIHKPAATTTTAAVGKHDNPVLCGCC